MRYLALMVTTIMISLGCESTPKEPKVKTLDWNKTASEQKLEVGDSIIIEGYAHNIVDYYLSERTIYPNLEEGNYIVHEPRIFKKRWIDKKEIALYNPEQPNVKENPNVPIGSVIFTIFNPNHEENSKDLYDMYPYWVRQETVKEAFNRGKYYVKYETQFKTDYNGKIREVNIRHRFRVTGLIRSFSRKTLQGVSLRCIDIDLSNIEVISSETLSNLEIWRTQQNRLPNIVYEIDGEIIIRYK